MNLSALWFAFRIGMRRIASEKIAMAGQVIVYAILVVSYAIVFQGVKPDALARFNLKTSQLIWYFVVTQAVVTCSYYYYRELEITIRSGDIEPLLVRPVEFWPMLMAEWLGQYVARMLVVLPVGIVCACCCGGGRPEGGLASWLLTAFCLLASGMLFNCLHLLVGCTAPWANPIEQVYRFWQKLLFFVGARTSPLIFYPAFMAGLAWLTPFPAVLAVSGNAAAIAPPRAIVLQMAMQLCWLAAGLFVASRAARRLRRHVGRGG